MITIKTISLILNVITIIKRHHYHNLKKKTITRKIIKDTIWGIAISKFKVLYCSNMKVEQLPLLYMNFTLITHILAVNITVTDVWFRKKNYTQYIVSYNTVEELSECRKMGNIHWIQKRDVLKNIYCI